MTRRDTRSYYDAFSERYEDQRHEGYHVFLDEMETRTVEPYVRGKSVLEAGCGTGLILERLKPLARSLVGVDLSHGMLRRARERGHQVVQASLLELPFPDATFDTVCSFKVLAHVEDARAALAELSRVVKPGGHLVLEYYNRQSLRYLVKRLKPAQEVAAGTTDEHVYTRYDSLGDLRALLPADVELVDVGGIRVIAPLAALFNLPVVGAAVEAVERAASASPLRRFGGFLLVILRKRRA
ncbi:MAG: hypothetical protein AMXMBFR64_01270 [Myxococcales bacterium]